MSRRTSYTNLRMRCAQDAAIDRIGRKEDDYDDENPSTLPIKKMNQFTRQQREAMKAQENRSVISHVGEAGWVPEKGDTSDDGYYKKWFNRNQKGD